MTNVRPINGFGVTLPERLLYIEPEAKDKISVLRDRALFIMGRNAALGRSMPFKAYEQEVCSALYSVLGSLNGERKDFEGPLCDCFGVSVDSFKKFDGLLRVS